MRRVEFLNRLSGHKNLIFLCMCLGVHLLNALIFGLLGILPFLGINILSTLFYLCMLALYEKESDKEIILIYIEIIVFSVFCDALIGGIYHYFYFVMGMVSVISYLLSENAKHKHLAQGSGAIVAIVCFLIQSKGACILSETREACMPYEKFFALYNIVVTIFTMIYVSALYSIELASTREKLKYTSNHDTLTGLYNRRFFEQTLKRSVTENSCSYSIAMFDIDNFKRVNDTYGHDAGDRVLEAVSNCLQKNLVDEQLAIRWGGEEFILYMPLVDLDGAFLIVEKICNDIRNLDIQLKDNSSIHVTATVGIQTGTDLAKYEEVISQADDKLYRGKHLGKNCIVIR